MGKFTLSSNCGSLMFMLRVIIEALSSQEVLAIRIMMVETWQREEM